MAVCGKMVVCWDYLKRPCKRNSGHTPGHCNPFSTDHPDEPKKGKDITELFNRVLTASKKIAA